MKKLVVCQYKNGSLLFGTVEGYTEVKASQIQEIFKKEKLITELRSVDQKLFTVIGKLQMDYDPFVSGVVEWDEVVSQMIKTKNHLQESLERLNLQEQVLLTGTNYAFPKATQDKAAS